MDLKVLSLKVKLNMPRKIHIIQIWRNEEIIKVERFVFQWNPTNIHYWDVPWTETNGGWEMIWKKVTDLSCSHQPFNNGSRMTSRSTASIHSSMPTLLMTTTSCEGSGFGTNNQRDSNCQMQIHQLEVQSEIWYVVFWEGELRYQHWFRTN